MSEETMLNSKIEFITRANSVLNPLDPKAGIFLIGNRGIEFRAEKGPGFIQIPWGSIVEIRVQMFFKGKYVRGFFVQTNENQLLEFIVSDAKEALRKMHKHLKREQFIKNPSNLMQIFKKNK